MRNLAAFALVVVLASGCSDEEDCGDCSPDDGRDRDRTAVVAPDEAQGEYGGVVDDVAGALAAAGDTTATRSDSTFYVQGKDGVCEFWSARYELPVWFGRDLDLDDARTAVEGAVPDGWTVSDDVDASGGYSALDATEDSTGAVLEVRAKGTTSVQLIAPVTGDCTKDGTTSPLPSPS